MAEKDKGGPDWKRLNHHVSFPPQSAFTALIAISDAQLSVRALMTLLINKLVLFSRYTGMFTLTYAF
jgi:hypothetical protein